MSSDRVNTALLAVLADLNLRAESARVTVRDGTDWRSLEVVNGELRGADGNLMSERIGQILVSLGWLDGSLIQPILKEGLANHRSFGQQLLVDGLTDSTRIAEGLRLQCLRRFEAILLMPGTIERGPHEPGLGGLQRPLGAALLEAFRENLPLATIAAILKAPPFAPLPAAERPRLVERLGMLGAEARLWRRLSKGESAQRIFTEAAGDKKVWRFLAALVALGLVDWR